MKNTLVGVNHSQLKINRYPSARSSSAFIKPARVEPPDLSALITFLAGDCNKEMISPINSSLDLRVLIFLKRVKGVKVYYRQ